MSSTDKASPSGQKILVARNMLAPERKVSGYRVETPIHGTSGPRTSFFHCFVWNFKISRKTHELNYESGMMDSWNQFCFTGGYVEVAVTFPGLS